MGAATYPHEDYRPSFMLSRIIAWGPIWGGVVIAVGVQALLTVLGMAVGLTVMDATRDTAGGAPEGSGVVAANTSPTIVGEEGTRDFTRTATTDRIAEGSASVAWWTFVVMALSAGAAVLGGAMGPRSGEMQRRLA